MQAAWTVNAKSRTSAASWKSSNWKINLVRSDFFSSEEPTKYSSWSVGLTEWHNWGAGKGCKYPGARLEGALCFHPLPPPPQVSLQHSVSMPIWGLSQKYPLKSSEVLEAMLSLSGPQKVFTRSNGFHPPEGLTKAGIRRSTCARSLPCSQASQDIPGLFGFAPLIDVAQIQISQLGLKSSPHRKTKRFPFVSGRPTGCPKLVLDTAQAHWSSCSSIL